MLMCTYLSFVIYNIINNCINLYIDIINNYINLYITVINNYIHFYINIINMLLSSMRTGRTRDIKSFAQCPRNEQNSISLKKNALIYMVISMFSPSTFCLRFVQTPEVLLLII